MYIVQMYKIVHNSVHNVDNQSKNPIYIYKKTLLFKFQNFLNVMFNTLSTYT